MLRELFSALGFEHGKGWKDSVSEGAPFLGPVGTLELVHGRAVHHTDLWVEVTDLDSIQDVLVKNKIQPVPYVFETDWDARAITAEPVKGLKIAFWQKNRPKSSATEGGMNARGMTFAIPSQARTLAQTGKYDAIIPLGCLIRGDTTHYEHIATEVTRGIGQSAQETGVPHTYGVLTCENLEQAIDRAGLKAGNKGWEAAITAIEMASLKSKLKRGASDVC